MSRPTPQTQGAGRANVAASSPADTRGRPSGAAPFGVLVAGLAVLLVAQRVLVDETWRMALSGLGGALVVAAALWRGVAWRRATGAVRRAERALWAGHVAVAVGVGLFAVQSALGRTTLGLATLELAADSDVAVVLEVLWLAVLVTGGLATLAMERAWLAMPVAASVEPSRVRSAGLAAVSLAFGLVFVLGANYAAARKDIRRDVTFFKTTRPSGTTLSYVKQLEEPVTVLLFFAPVSDVLPQVRPYFDALAAANPRLTVSVRDHAVEPELARRYRIRDNGFVVLVRGDGTATTGAAAKAGDAADDAVARRRTKASERFEIGDELEPARRNLKKLDATFQKRFTKLTRAPRRVRFTSGHKERSQRGEPTDRAGQRLETVHALLERFNIGSDGLGLGDGLARDVPKGTSAVIVAGPRERFIDEEVDALIRYVRGGGRVLLMLDPASDLKGRQAGDSGDGLDRLLKAFGVVRLPGTVASVGHHMRSTFTKADRALIYTNTFSSHPAVSSASRNSLRVAAVMARGVALDRAKPIPKGARVTFPMRSSADCWRDVDGDLVRGKTEPREKLNLMAAVSVPATGPKPKAAGGPDPGRSSEGRLVVIGDGDFASNGLMKTGGNALVFVDSLRWLIGDDQVSGDLSSEEDVPIEHRKDDDRVWFYATTFAVPLPLLLLGLWVGRRRRTGGR